MFRDLAIIIVSYVRQKRLEGRPKIIIKNVCICLSSIQCSSVLPSHRENLE